MNKHWYVITGLIAFVYLATIWMLPVLPCQDLPQHLAYARIFMDYGRPDLLFQEFYTMPTRLEPYHVLYWLLAGIAHAVGLRTALRVVMTAYLLGMFGAFHALVRSVWGRSHSASWSTCLATALIWNPVVCMGFISFALCIPIWLAACAALVSAQSARRPTWQFCVVAGCCAILASIHVAAAGCFVLFAAIFAISGRTGKHFLSLAMVAIVSISMVIVWSKFGGGLGIKGRVPNVGDSIRRAFGLEFLDLAFRLVWHSPTIKANYVLWTAIGPYRPLYLLVVAAVLAGMILIVWKARQDWHPLEEGNLPRGFRAAVLGFAGLSIIAPWGFYIPSEITFIDLRMMTLAFGLVLAFVRPAWFRARAAQGVLVLTALFLPLHFAFHAFGFAREAAGPLGLEMKVPPNAVMASLAFHGRSAHFGKRFQLTHFLPMYFTVDEGGIATQFWARYTEHLPVGYVSGKRALQPADWSPEKFTASHLNAVDYVLIQQADINDDSVDVQYAYRRARAILDDRATLVDCAGEWCLFATARKRESILSKSAEVRL